MATATTNYGMTLPSADDIYDIEQYNDNMRMLDDALSGINVKFLTGEEYSRLSAKGEHTLYFVLNGSRVKMYLGDMELAGANKDQGTIICLTAQKQLTAGSYTVIPGEET